jgi:hypothetical protein
MKTKLTLIFLALFCSLNISAQIEKKYYSNTTILKETGNLKNGLKDGIWETYYENGKLETVGNYAEGENKGEWKVYFDNGQLAAVGNYTSTKFPTPETWKFYTKDGVEEIFDCPKPTKDQLQGVCISIYDRSKTEIDSELPFEYLEELWTLSCADPKKESVEQAKIKIQIMWNANREAFRCYSFPGVTVSEGNVLKFSTDTSFPYFLTTTVKKYQLDMNFIDPADGKTMMDFLKTGIDRYTQQGNTGKAFEYQRIYDLFAKNGAKHAKDL